MPRLIHSSLYLCDPNLSIDIKGYHTSIIQSSFLIRKAMGSAPRPLRLDIITIHNEPQYLRE
jgi:hypothetical protein